MSAVAESTVAPAAQQVSPVVAASAAALNLFTVHRTGRKAAIRQAWADHHASATADLLLIGADIAEYVADGLAAGIKRAELVMDCCGDDCSESDVSLAVKLHHLARLSGCELASVSLRRVSPLVTLVVRDAETENYTLGSSSRPVPHKGALIKDWPNLRLSEADLARHFRPPCNIGVLLGEPSHWLIDVDLDDELAVKLADDHLPQTGAEFGRSSKPRSHREYISNQPLKTKKFRSPDGSMIVEVRSTGAQTVFPGSVHESGEPIEWTQYGDPARIDADELLTCVESLNSAVLISCDRGTEYTEDTELRKLSSVLSVPPSTLSTPPTLSHDTENQIFARTVPSGPGQRIRALFALARELKGVPGFADAAAQDFRPIIERWFSAALPQVRTKDFTTSWFDFLKAWNDAKYTAGSGPIDAAFARAMQSDAPSIAGRYDNVKVKLLVGLCRELQVSTGSEPFFLSCRTAGRLLCVDHATAARWLSGLTLDDVLQEVTKGSKVSRKASRYLYRGTL